MRFEIVQAVRAPERLLAASIVLLLACGGEGGTGPGGDESNAVSLVSVVASTDSVVINESAQLSAVATTAAGDTVSSASFQWSSSDAGVASVNSAGMLAAHSAGVVTITATIEGKSGQVTINVVSILSFVTAVELPDDSVEVAWDESITLSAAVSARDARTIPSDSVFWSSSNDDVLTVTGPGMIHARDAGIATITATAGAFNDSVVINVPRIGIVSLGLGRWHGCGLSADSLMYCWGSNSRGQLLDGTTMNQVKPQLAGTDLRFVQLAAGAAHTCGLTSANEAYCWGWNVSGQLGIGDLNDSQDPVRVATDVPFERIAAANEVTCGLSLSGEAYCWGLTWLTAPATDSTGIVTFSRTPQLVPSPVSFASIAVPMLSMCGLDAMGVAYCWGFGAGGELGDGTLPDDRAEPGPVAGAHSFTEISGGLGHFCGLDAAGAIYCWGDNAYGAVGVGTITGGSIIEPVNIPSLVVGGRTFQTLSRNVGRHRCALDADGSAFCWGDNSDGQIGDGTNESCASTLTSSCRPAPAAVSGGLSFTSIHVGLAFTCGISEGSVYCWGANDDGQLGIGSTASQREPVKVLGT